MAVHPTLLRYKIIFTDRVKRSLNTLSRNDFEKINNKIMCLCVNAAGLDIKKLKSKRYNLYRLRVGNYRIIYNIEHEQITICVLAVGLRKDVYKKMHHLLGI